MPKRRARRPGSGLEVSGVGSVMLYFDLAPPPARAQPRRCDRKIPLRHVHEPELSQ